MRADRLTIFDCDGVLVDSEPLAAEAYVRVYAKHGMDITADVIAQGVGMKQADIIRKIEEITGHLLTEDKEADIWSETKLLFTEKLVSTGGVEEFIASLPTARCVASSSSLERIYHSLEVTGVEQFFPRESIFSSSMVKRGKPAPDLFLHAAAQMGFDPSVCTVIEDSPFGVQGGVAAGMKVIGYVGGGHTYEGHADVLRKAGAHAICHHYGDMHAVMKTL
ncbi:HAD family hydrolase [Limoniibacter endophyticus]|uniref:Haloacid dehalogenase n=1 Tax=Limoniibacter endophyticus TaxID=1565040 RepID=A0A8J3GI54_9HYPH|nr:HAD family hydrolase [Limoniibacter endophyticus]GHC74957.1 haloacid dehalogenase [Limoniibacter endophyticus]